MYSQRLKKFKELYNKLSNMYGGVEVFMDFAKMSAISMYNSFAKNQKMEQEYLRTINKYEKEHQDLFAQMLAELIMEYEESEEIKDILGPFYERANLCNRHLDQFFTPAHIAELMSEVMMDSQGNLKEIVKSNGFISILEPSCGAGRYDFGYGKNIRKKEYKTSRRYTCSCSRYI